MDLEIFLLFVSAILLAVGVYRWQKGSYLIRYGKKATTIVLDNKAKRSGRQTYYYPVIEVKTDDNKSIAHTLNIGFEEPLAHGTQLKIIYDPEDLDNVELDSKTKLEFTPRLLVVAGLCGLVVVFLEVLEVTQLID